MPNIHLNNHISSKQDPRKTAMELFDAIVQSGYRTITLTIDDGDGDFWKYEITVTSNRIPEINQIKEN